MSSSLIDSPNEQTHSERALRRMRCFYLGLPRNFGYNSLAGVLALVCVPIVEALVAQKLAEEASVGCHA